MSWLRSRSAISVYVVAALWGVIAFTCIDHEPYRVKIQEGKFRSINTSIAELASGSDEYRRSVESCATEIHGEQFTLHFIEFDDSGWLWNRKRAQQILEDIKKNAEARGAVMVVYVHGWKHNAGVCDTNVGCFRDVLRYLSEAERARYGERRREIIGVYLGWRGASSPLPVVKEFTFFGRKAAAHAIGNGEAIEVLSRLNVIYKDLAIESERRGHVARSRLVTVGHSMGGAVVFSAIAGAMKDRVVTQTPTPTTVNFAAPVDGFGDLVVLVNPAFEASIYRSIAARSRSTFSEKQTPLLITVGSEKDHANQIAFPIGRFLGTMLHSASTNEQREATRTSLANYDPWVTHYLKPVAGGLQAKAEKAPECGCPTPLPPWAKKDPDCKGTLTPATLHFADGGCFGSAELTRNPKLEVHRDNPFMVIRAANDVVKEHNGIFNPTFTDFLVTFVVLAERKKTSVLAAAAATMAPASRTAATVAGPAAALPSGAPPRVPNIIARATVSAMEPTITPAPVPAPATATVTTPSAPPPSPEAPRPVPALTDAGFDEALQSTKPVFVMFWAPWAGPARIMKPTVEEVAALMSDRVDFYLINVDDNPEVAQRYNVTSIPVVTMFRDGTLVDRAVGAMPRDLLERFVMRNVK